jgi:outer membrane protein assembly factor BamB
MLCAGCLLSTVALLAQEQRNDWPVSGSDIGQSGWQKDELGLTPESVPGSFKFLWKIKLGEPAKTASTFSEPLLAGRLINAQGFKDFVYWSSADTLYAVDSELGNLLWKKQFDAAGAKAPAGCAVSSLPMLIEPPVVINFAARRKRPPGTPRPPDPPTLQSNERKLGVAPGGGYFGFKGIYVLTPDGMLHEQIMTTGKDFAPPVKFLPSADASPYGLNIADKAIFTATGHDCGDTPNGLWSIDLSSGTYSVASYNSQKVRPLNLTGPVLDAEGTSFLVTGPGTADASAGVYPSSVVAIAKDMKVKDWYTPEGGMASYDNVSPIAIDYKDKHLIVAPGKDGTIALLDAASLGGADHRTPLSQTEPLTKAGEKHGWDGFASWQKDGATWVYASISAPISLSGSSLPQSAPATHGAIVAFKISDSGGKPTLEPAWVSPDMVNPAPPRVTNGVVIALARGDSNQHATLHVLNAATGAELYSSKDAIPTFTGLSGVAVGDSHAFFVDHDNVLYSFGIGLEH